jgi:hypothetical protein
MGDYGILKKIRESLKVNPQIIALGLDNGIYFAPPERGKNMILLELEEIWTSVKLGDYSPYVKIKFKASTIMEYLKGHEALGISDAIQHALDGKCFSIEEEMKATLRLAGSVIELPQANQPRCVHQYYEALIRT